MSRWIGAMAAVAVLAALAMSGGAAPVTAAVVEPVMVMDMVKVLRQENRTAGKERPIEPGVPPVVWV